MNPQSISIFKALRVSALGAIAMVFAHAVPAAPQWEVEALTGTWLVQVQQYDCSSQAALGEPFESFLSFEADRTLIETTNNPAFEPGQRSAGHGLWARTGADTFRAVSEAFIIFSSPARGAIPPFAAGRQRIEQSIDYTGGDHFTSEAQVFFTDPNGTVLRSGCARANARRLTD